MLVLFNATNIVTIVFLVFLEGLLSLDNALVLAMLVRGLPKKSQKKALTYGVWGAFIFRFVSLFFLTYLMEFPWLKVVGGLYLLYIAISEYFFGEDVNKKPSSISPVAFWRVVLLIEVMDAAFSIDNILAAVSVSTNYFVVMAGGMLGIFTMRCAARLFVGIMQRFQRLQDTAFQLVAIIGTKLVIEGVFPHVDFHSSASAAPWIFWGVALTSIMQGFRTA